MERYSAKEILEIAINVERNGVLFYTKAAELLEDSELKELLLRLAEWEKSHIIIFEQIQQSIKPYLSKLGMFDPAEQMAINPKAMSTLSVFAMKPYLGRILHGVKSRNEILQQALKFERDSIVFFQGLKNFCKNAAGIDKLDDIICEEQKHCKIIEQSLKEL